MDTNVKKKNAHYISHKEGVTSQQKNVFLKITLLLRSTLFVAKISVILAELK